MFRNLGGLLSSGFWDRGYVYLPENSWPIQFARPKCLVLCMVARMYTGDTLSGLSSGRSSSQGELDWAGHKVRL